MEEVGRNGVKKKVEVLRGKPSEKERLRKGPENRRADNDCGVFEGVKKKFSEMMLCGDPGEGGATKGEMLCQGGGKGGI